MANTSAVCGIVVPTSEGPPDEFKLDDNEQVDSSKNSSDAVKVDSGSELTPRSRLSWANEVEEEHEATGWTGKPRAKVEGQDDAKSNGAPVKKSKKKKKKKSKAGPPSEEVSSVPAYCNLDEQMKGASTIVEGVAESALPTMAKSMPEGRSSVQSSISQLEMSNSSAKVTTANGSGITQTTSKAAEAIGSPHGLSKPNKLSATSVWVSRNFDGKGTTASAMHPGGVKDTLNGQGDLESPMCGERVENGESGWETAGSHKGRRGQETFGKSAEVPVAYNDVYVPTPSPNGNWDEDISSTDIPSSNWDSGWEVAGARRNKRGDDSHSKSLGVPNLGQSSKGRGQKPGGKFNEQVLRGGNKQRLGEWEKATRGRSAGNIAQEKSRRPSPKNMGRGEGTGSVGSPRQTPTQSAWGKPPNKLTHSSSNLSSSSLTTSQISGATSSVKSGGRGDSVGILGKLFPAERGVPEHGVQEFMGERSNNIDAWKGGFAGFSGSGSSVFDEYPGSLYSDSQCSDDDFDSDTMSLASFDSAESHKSHTTQKRNKWFRKFFQDLDELTEDQLQEHDRQWHCPACQGGVGAIDWYRGLQPLLAHAKTVRSKRVKLHKAFAEVLEEEVRIRGAAAGTHGSGKYGKWRGLGDDHDNKDTLIVWPPMVVIRNTQLEQDEVDKWTGMGNKELLEIFQAHNPVKARHAYGPQGHRGISILIFAESPTGYYDAQRLDKHFKDARRGRDNWNSQGKVLFQPGGNRILYGYIASPEDLEIFNKHSKGKQNLKWEKRSLQEQVLNPMRRMHEENTKVAYLQGQVQREMEASKTLKKTMSQMMKKLHMREDELKVIRERAREQYKQQETEMEDMETLYKSKIDQLKQEIVEKEAGLQKVHEDYEQEHLDQCEQLEQRAKKIPKDKNLSDELQQQQTLVEEEIARHSQLVELCIKRQEEWEARKVELLKEHHQKMMEFKSRQWQELLAFEENLEKERMIIMNSFKFPAANELGSSGSQNIVK